MNLNETLLFRLADAYRYSTFVMEYIIPEAQKQGLLGDYYTDAEVSAAYKALKPEYEIHGLRIGDDLTMEDLNNLWVHLAGDEYPNFGWWDDKPHQIGYRLLLRLTRAEEELKDALWRLEGLEK